MDYEEALKILIELMIENKDVLLRLKEGDNNYYDKRTADHPYNERV